MKFSRLVVLLVVDNEYLEIAKKTRKNLVEKGCIRSSATKWVSPLYTRCSIYKASKSNILGIQLVLFQNSIGMVDTSSTSGKD